MPVLIGREKVSPLMQSALRRRIMHEREKRKQEVAEAEKDFERKAREEEERRKKLEEEHSTLEDIKEELNKLKEKHSQLQEEKHALFWQFRKVLHDEAKQKARLQQSEPTVPHTPQYTQHGMPMNPHRMLPQGYRYGHGTPYMNQAQQLQQGVKRPHSPTPPASGSLQMHQRPPTTITSSPLVARKPHEQSSQFDDRYRSYFPMGQRNKPSTNFDSRNNNPQRRLNVKTERDHATFSPSSGTAPPQPHHKYLSSQSGGRPTMSKHS